MTASAVDNDIDGNGTLDLAYEDLNASGFVDERDMAIVMAATGHPGINFPYQTADQAKLKSDLEQLAADIKSGKIKITDNADGSVTLDVIAAPPPPSQPPAGGPTKAEADVIDVNAQQTEEQKRQERSALELAEATERANAARRRLETAQRGEQPSWFARTFMGGGTEGEEVLGSAWSGTKSFLGRAWEATSGTFNHMRHNVGGQNILGAVAGVIGGFATAWGFSKIPGMDALAKIPLVGPLLSGVAKLAAFGIGLGFFWTQTSSLLNGRKTAFENAVDAASGAIQGYMAHTPADLKEHLATDHTSQNALMAGWAMNNQDHIGQNTQRVLLFKDQNDQMIYDEIAAFRKADGAFALQLRADNGETFMAHEVLAGSLPQGSGQFTPVELSGIGLPIATTFEAVRHDAAGAPVLGGARIQEPIVFTVDGRTFLAEGQGFDPNVLGTARNAPPAPTAPSPGGS